MVEISVIIPIYNVEDYLYECINHIVNQSFKDIEIICINDGSTDKSMDILNQFKDNRINIITQENKGLGASRNVGIKHAKGKYVYFMDADDYLELTALEELYVLCEKLNTDFIMFKLKNFDDITKEIIEDEYYSMPYLKNRVGDNIFNYNDVKDIALDLAVNSPGNFFKREFIKDLKYPEGLLYEDNVFFTKALFKANKIYFYDKFLYNRRVRKNSLSKSPSLDTIDITDLLLDIINEYGYTIHKKELYYRIFNNIYKIFENTPEKYKEEVFLKIKEKYQKYSEKWQEDSYFRNELNPRYKNIFESAINSDSPAEFELRVKLFDSEKKLKKLKKQNKKLKK
jgi:glycosyltransferase involved in cell wall biosynthesis